MDMMSPGRVLVAVSETPVSSLTPTAGLAGRLRLDVEKTAPNLALRRFSYVGCLSPIASLTELI